MPMRTLQSLLCNERRGAHKLCRAAGTASLACGAHVCIQEPMEDALPQQACLQLLHLCCQQLTCLRLTSIPYHSSLFNNVWIDFLILNKPGRQAAWDQHLSPERPAAYVSAATSGYKPFCMLQSAGHDENRLNFCLPTHKHV